MKFDDFNYELFNPYILIESTKKSAAEISDGDGTSVAPHAMKRHKLGETPALSLHALEAQKMGQYEFQSISVKTPENSGKNEELKPKAEEEAKEKVVIKKAADLEDFDEKTVEKFNSVKKKE